MSKTIKPNNKIGPDQAASSPSVAGPSGTGSQADTRDVGGEPNAAGGETENGVEGQDSNQSAAQKERPICKTEEPHELEVETVKNFWRSMTSAAKHNKHRKMKCLIESELMTNVSVENDFREWKGYRIVRQALAFSQQVGHESLEIILNKLLEPGTELNRSSDHQSTPIFHIAVARQDIKGVELILNYICGPKDPNEKRIMLNKIYKGSPAKKKTKLSKLRDRLFDYCCSPSGNRDSSEMMDSAFAAERPLLIAAWNTDPKMFDLLVEEGAAIHKRTTENDNVFHVLIKASHSIRQSEVNESSVKKREHSILSMFEYVIKKIRREPHGVKVLDVMLKEENNSGYHPIVLAARLGCLDIFQLIINCEDVFRFPELHSDNFNNYYYDITQIESTNTARRDRENKQNTPERSGPNSCDRDRDVERANDTQPESSKGNKSTSKKSPRCSVLQMIIYSSREIDKTICFKFTETTPILNIVKEKWKYYSAIFFLWGIIHCFLTGFISYYSLTRLSNPLSNNSNINATVDPKGSVVYTDKADDVIRATFEIIFIIYCVMLSFGVLFTTIRNRGFPVNIATDALYRIELLTLGPLSILTLILRFFSPSSEVVPLCLLLLISWLFLIYFIQGWKPFSYFSMIMQMAIFQDMLKVLTVYAFVIAAFAISGTLLFQNHPYQLSTSPRYDAYGSALYADFLLGLGLGDTADHDQSLVPNFTMIVFIVFALFAHVFLLNVLIALISETCAKLGNNKHAIRHFQQLSVILFIESHIPPYLRHTCGRIKKNRHEFTLDEESGKAQKNSKKQSRFYEVTLNIPPIPFNVEDKSEGLAKSPSASTIA